MALKQIKIRNYNIYIVERIVPYTNQSLSEFAHSPKIITKITNKSFIYDRNLLKMIASIIFESFFIY